jgi:hypothetical protein
VTKRRIAVVDDPTVESTEVLIEGKTYRMCLDFRSLRLAERELNKAGHKINILYEFPRLTLDSTCIVFAASIRRFHPEVSYEAAEDLLVENPVNAYRVSDVIGEAFMKAMAAPRKGDAVEGRKNPT